MSANISIKEGGIGRPFNAAKLRTVQPGGGTVDWVPKSDVERSTIYANENGIYQPASEGVYAYDEVRVNVPELDSFVGTGSDGNDYSYKKKGGGGGGGGGAEEIEVEKLPSSIRVITPPTFTGPYDDGEPIDITGLTVAAYDAKGNEMQTVPIGEITINPKMAMYDPEKGKKEAIAEYDGMSCPYAAAANTYFAFGATEEEKANNTYGFPTVRGSTHVYGVRCNGANYLVSASPFSGTYRGYGWTIIPIVGRTFNDGYMVQMGSTAADWYPNIEYVPSKSGLSISQAMDCVLKGKLEPLCCVQTITVSWPRPRDGKVLKNDFEISVNTSNQGEREGI